MPPSPLVDIGINLTHASYDRDRPDVLGRAAAAGVTTLVVTGADLTSAHAATALLPAAGVRLYSTAGIHPHHAGDCTPAAVTELRSLAGHARVVAIGECGLDYYRRLCPRPVQLLAFERQLTLAIELGLPLFLHCREAHDDFVAVLDAAGSRLPPAVVHCFTGSRSEVDACLARGLYVGQTGFLCDERRGGHLGEVAAAVPDERLLVETDGPYLLPRTLPGKPKDRRNEPAFLPHVVDALARARGATADAVARLSTRNACRLFGIEPPAELTSDK